MKLNITQMRDVVRGRKGAEGFTLLELLIVVAILAIIGGALLAAYEGLQASAAKGVATNTIASASQTVRAFTVLENELPNNLESLLAGDPAALTYDANQFDNLAAGLDAAPTEPAFLETGFAGKIAPAALTATQLTNLKAAGVTLVRYLDPKGIDETVDDLEIKAADNTAATNVGKMSEIDIPSHAFEAPRPGDKRNRGRGFALNLADPAFTAANVQMAIWGGQTPAAPTSKYDNVKVGANATAVLVAFGLGEASSIVNANNDKTGNVGNARFQSAPLYGNVKKNEYNHYVMLVDVEQNPARLVAIVDSRGDFLAEEYAEATGQKQ